jgi:hypothetical protein
MAAFEPAVEDLNWLEPEELYLASGESCEIDRPLFQGDIFTEIPLPVLPKTAPTIGKSQIEFVESIAMVVPHPCQCYYGDKLRPAITVAPVTQVLNYDNFGKDRDGKRDAFALPDLMGGEGVSYIANFGKLVSLPSSYLELSKRIACLTHMGIGLLSKRFIRFQSRVPSQLAQVMAFSQDQWNEAYLMQAWVRKFGKLKGFTEWMKSQIFIESIDPNNQILPRDYLTSSLPELLEAVRELQ